MFEAILWRNSCQGMRDSLEKRKREETDCDVGRKGKERKAIRDHRPHLTTCTRARGSVYRCRLCLHCNFPPPTPSRVGQARLDATREGRKRGVADPPSSTLAEITPQAARYVVRVYGAPYTRASSPCRLLFI